MSTGAASPPQSRRPQRKNSTLITTLVIVGVLIALFVFGTQIYTDVLWYDQLGFLNVFVKENFYKPVSYTHLTLPTKRIV